MTDTVFVPAKINYEALTVCQMKLAMLVSSHLNCVIMLNLFYKPFKTGYILYIYELDCLSSNMKNTRRLEDNTTAKGKKARKHKTLLTTPLGARDFFPYWQKT